MKAIRLFLLLFAFSATPAFAQTIVIDEADTARYGINRSRLHRQYPYIQQFFEKRPQEAQTIMQKSSVQFALFAKKVKLSQYKLDFIAMEAYEPTGEAKYVLVEWRKAALDSTKQKVLALLTEYYKDKRVTIEANTRFSIFNFYEANPVVKRTVRKMSGAIGTLEAARQTTRPDTVRILYFHQLELTQVPDVVYRFPNLTELDLSKNGITHLPARLTAEFPKLEKLSLLYNALRQDSIAFVRNKHLKALNIQGNNLESFPTSVRKNRRLESLWLGNNNLKTANFRGLRRINDLNLYSAGLTEIPRSITKLRRVRVLDLYYNQLTELSPRLRRLRRLEQLAVSHNKLRQLPDQLARMPRLQVLYAHHNEIGTLPVRFERFRSLRLLDLGYNFFSTTPPVLDRLYTLEELDLSGNNLQELSPGLGQLPNLKKVYLRGNPITDAQPRTVAVKQTIQQLEARKTEVFH